MKILFIHNFYKQFGGEDAAVSAEKKLFESCGEKIVFYERDNHEIDDFGLLEKVNFSIDALYSTRTAQDVAEITRSLRPDVAYIHNVFPLISPSVYHVLYSSNIPTLQVAHDFRFLCPNGWFYTQGHICEKCKHGNYLHAVRYRCYRDSYALSALYAASLAFNRRKGLFQKIAGFLCLTEFSRKKLAEVNIPERKLFIRPNFIDSSVSPANPGVGDYVLYIGRLSSEKGVWTLIKAFERLKTLQLKVMGTGPLEGELRSYICSRNISNIELLGFKSGQEKWDGLRRCSFVIVPSECYETFCVAVLEAYVAGKPVVASNIGGLPYVVEDGKSGRLFDPKNIEDLICKINDLSRRPADIGRMGAYGRMLSETKYSAHRSFERFKEIAAQVSIAP